MCVSARSSGEFGTTVGPVIRNPYANPKLAKQGNCLIDPARVIQSKVKEVVGKVMGNKDLEMKGNIQKNVGTVQASVGDAKANIAKTAKTAKML